MNAQIVAFIPSHFAGRIAWLQEAIASAKQADRTLVVSTYPRPESIHESVDWVHKPTLETTGSKYREAVRRTRPGDVIAILDDDDLWTEEKVGYVRESVDEGASYVAHAAKVLRGKDMGETIQTWEANGSMQAISRDVLTSPEIRPFLDRLEWACDPFLRYVRIASDCETTMTDRTFAWIRYHHNNSSHPPKGGYQDFDDWRRSTADRYLSGWRLIEEMTRDVPYRPLEVEQKVLEFEDLTKMSPMLRRLSYVASRV